jgi:hypothetical protein
MRKRQFYLAPWIASVAASVATLASAAGFDGGGTAAVLGQPLAFVTQVRLDPGESLEPACVAAEVMAGDRAAGVAGAHQHRVAADGGARIRVATSLAVDEPVISVALSVGCQVRLTRNYIVLADPPETAPVAASPGHGACLAARPPMPMRSGVRHRRDSLQPRSGTARARRRVAARRARHARGRRTARPSAAASQPATPATPCATSAPAPRIRAPTAEAPPWRRGRPPASLRLDFVEPVRHRRRGRRTGAGGRGAGDPVRHAQAAAARQRRHAGRARTMSKELGAEAQASRDEAAQLRARWKTLAQARCCP